jgi:hypothetical protein
MSIIIVCKSVDVKCTDALKNFVLITLQMGYFKDVNMDVRPVSPNIRNGRFLWMDEKEQKRYLAVLNKKITEGFFASDQILSRLVDEMAPVFNDFLDGDIPSTNLSKSYR